MKNLVITFLLILPGVSNGQMQKFRDLKVKKSNHFLYRLSIGYAEGSFVTKEAKNVKLRVYGSPNINSRVLFNVPVFDSERDHPGEIFTLFDNGKTLPRAESIYSTEKKGDFFKVAYKGKIGWVNKKQFYGIRDIESLVHENSFYISDDYGKVSLHEKPNSQKIVRDDISSINKRETEVKVLSYKWVESNLWLEVEIWEEGCSGKKYFKKPLRGWIFPFNKNGKPKFSDGSC
jgi:hypothetical protein